MNQVLRDFLPAGDLDAAGLGDVQHAVREVVLEPGDVRHAVRYHQRPAGRRALPGSVRHLVAADVDGFQRDAGLGMEGDQVVEHFLDEGIGGRQGNVDYVIAVVLGGIVFGGIFRVPEPVGCVPGRAEAVFHGLDRGAGMARDVEFGDDEHVAGFRILEDLDVIGLGVETVAGGLGVVPVGGDAVGVEQGVRLRNRSVLVQGRDTAVSAIRREFREAVHLHAPAFVVTEVQVQAVRLVMGEDVDEFVKLRLTSSMIPR